MHDELNKLVKLVVDQVRMLEQRRELLIIDGSKAKVALETANNEVHIMVQVVKLLQSVAEAKREALRERVEAIVDRAIKGIFGYMYSFRLDASMSRGQMTVNPQIGRSIPTKIHVEGEPNHVMVWDDVSNCGGGINDIVSFVMRVVVLSLYTPHRQRVIIADEPFKHVSRFHLPAAADMVRQLADIANMQFLIVTHKFEVDEIADKSFTVQMDMQGVSTVTEIING